MEFLQYTNGKQLVTSTKNIIHIITYDIMIIIYGNSTNVIQKSLYSLMTWFDFFTIQCI